MRVTLVGTHYWPYVGGIETHMRQLARGLRDRGHEVRIVCLAPARSVGFSPSTTAQVDGVEVARVRTMGVGEALRWPSKLFDAPSDVIHFHGFSRPLFLRTLVDRGGARLVITPHGGVYGAFLDTHPVRRQMKRIFDMGVAEPLLRRAHVIIALNAAERSHLVNQCGVDSNRVRVLPNAVPSEALALSSAEQGGSGRLLVLQRLNRQKRIVDLLAVLKSDPALPPCDIAGPDEDGAEEIRRLARELPPGRVRLLGVVSGDEKITLIRRALAMVFCSELEPMSISALEALAQETPLVASDTAVPTVAGRAALTFPMGNGQLLHERLRSLQKPAELARLRDAARRARHELTTEDSYLTQLTHLYAYAHPRTRFGIR
jgi:glycogen(starch) synthase